MIVSFEACVRAIADVITDESGAHDAETVANVETFLLATCSRMPDHIRLALMLATMMFDAAPLLRTAKPFHRLDAQRRHEQLRRWQESRLNALRSVVAFYRSLAIFACATFESGHPSPAAQLGKSRGRSTR